MYKYKYQADVDLAEKLEEKCGFSEEEIEGFPIYYWRTIDELTQYLEKYNELKCVHTEDLLLYAMMFRNVSLGNNDIFDKKFFVESEKDIIGFKKKVYETKDSPKFEVLKLYYKFGLFFESLCYSLTGKRISIISKKTLLLNDSRHLENLIEGCLDNVHSISCLTDTECNLILNNKSLLNYSYCNSDIIFEVFPLYSTHHDFVEGIVIPLYCGGTNGFKFHCIQKYIIKSFGSKNNDVFNDTMRQQAIEIAKLENEICYLSNSPWNNTDEQIEKLKKEKVQLNNELQSLQKIPFVRAAYFPYNYSHIRFYNDTAYRDRIEKCEKEADLALAKKERQERDIESKIEEIDKQIQLKRDERIKQISQERHQMLINYTNTLFSNHTLWKELFDKQNELQAYCDHIYKLLYFRNLIYSPEICQKRLCVFSSNVDYLNKILKKDRIPWWNKKYVYKNNNNSYRILIREWRDAIESMWKRENEKERIQREKELKLRRKEEEKRLEQYRFNIRNRHWRDDNVTFREADHIYIVDGTPLDSVTTFVKNCFPDFDTEFHAKRKAEALGITKEAVLEMWDKKGRESRERGTEMHKKIESYYLGNEPSTDDTFDLFKIFANKITLKPYRTEWAVYDWEQKIAGTIDFVDYQNGEYIIYDWKRSDKLIAKNGLPIKNSQYGEKALPPIENLDDSPYYHYALQLSLYKYIIEKNYGITVSKLRLGIFHPSYNKPYVLEMPYLQNEIDTLFGLRSEVFF